MLKEKFEIWPANPILNMSLLAFGMHVINLGYLKDKFPCITKFLNSNREELDLGLGLDHTAAISDNDDKFLLDLSN